MCVLHVTSDISIRLAWRNMGSKMTVLLYIFITYSLVPNIITTPIITILNSSIFVVPITIMTADLTADRVHSCCREDIFKEIDILVGMNHENVIFLKEYFEEGNKVYLITELLTGGELLDAVLERGSYNEADARLSFVQLLRGIEYLHSK